MAVAVQSVSTTAWTGVDTSNTLVVNKPSGTADGDLLIAHISGADQISGTNNISAPGGWTTLGSQSAGASGSADLFVFYKIASSEGASYSFTNQSGANLLMAGAIYRIDGHGNAPSIQIALDGDDTADSTPTFTNTVTPLIANSLLLFLLTANDNAASGSVSGYSVTNDNPTWTEQYDMYGDGDSYFGAGDGDGLMSGASAVRSAVTATGDSTCTLTTFANRSVGAIVVIPPLTNISINASPLELTFTTPELSVMGTANVTPSTAEMTLSIEAPVVSTPTPDWDTTDKSSAGSWTNTTKS